MINVSNTIKQACNGANLRYREYVVLDGTTAQIDVATEMYATAYKDTHFIGTFNMKYIKFTTSNDVQYRNKELTLYKEINGEGFKVGNFIVTEINDDDSNEEVSVTAYDYGLKFAQPYKTGLDYESGNITLKDVLDEISENVGVELVNKTITNGDFIVDSNQFVNNELYGDVVSAVAYLSGDFAIITNENKLEFIFNTPTDEIIKDYVNLDDKRDTRPITSLSIGTSQVEGQNAVVKDEALIEQYGEHWLEINDVPFAYTLEKRELLKDAIFEKVKGFGYSSFKSEYAFKPYLQLGDLIQFRNKEGQLVNSIVLKITSKYDNIIIEAPSVTDATIEYENPKSVYDIARRAEIIANQATSEITAITIKTDEISEETHNNYQEILEKFDDYTPLSKTLEVETSVVQLQTDTYTKTEINTKLTDGSVTKVMTTSGTFDEDGMHYEKTGARTSSTINEVGVRVDDVQSNEELLFAGYDEDINESIVRTENLTVRKYFQMGDYSRFENYEDEDGNIGTGVFML